AGSPPEGPFQPGETVSFCFQVNTYQVDPIGSGNNCQWFQGIVPVFGNCWDPSSFGAGGEPVASSAPTPLFGAIWGWWTDITYNRATNVITVGDFDGDGVLEMCHISDPSCPNTGVSAGSVLPGGWFAHMPGQGASPNFTFGDGAGCNTTHGPWEVCFDVTTRLFPECNQDSTYTDCSVRMFTFADGETGSWNGPLSICANDFPTASTQTQRCCEGPTVDEQEIDLCNGDTLAITLTSNQDPDVTYSWVAIPDPAIDGATDGSGPAILQVLENTSNSTATVIYEVTGINGNEGCAGPPTEIIVNITPGLEVTSEPIDGCEGRPFVIGVDVDGGSGDYSYNWVTGDMGPNPTVTPTITTIYSVTVTDNQIGCTGVGNIEVTVNPNFDVEILGDSVVCEDQGGTGLEASGLGGSPPYQDYAWDTPDGPDNGEVIFATSTGTYSVTVTDDNGCFGEKTIEVVINTLPEIDILPTPTDRFCENSSDSIVLELLTPNTNIEQIRWIYPNDSIVDGQNSIIARDEGEYILIVTDDNLCESEESIMLEIDPSPNPTISGPTEVCQEGGSGMLTIDEFYDSYQWSTGSVTRSTPIDTAGLYSLTVVDNGCTGIAFWRIDSIPVPNPDLSGSSSFCTGFNTSIDAGAGFSTYAWSDGQMTQVAVFDEPDLYFVTVTDANGCVGIDSINITEEASLQPLIAGDTLICPGETTELDAGAGFTSYTWNTTPVLNDRVITVEPGSYTVEVSDGNCTGQATVNVRLNVPPTPTILGSMDLCEGETTTLRVDGVYESYVWSTDPNDTNDSLVISSGGMYMVSVTDSENCTGIATFNVNNVTTPDANITGNNTVCPGATVALQAEAGFSQYTWTGPNSFTANTQSINGSEVGLYEVTVVDATGCVGQDSLELQKI
ncbi:MAG: PKD-like domain-containing protein, partial [Bacteroidota bacterium]